MYWPIRADQSIFSVTQPVSRSIASQAGAIRFITLELHRGRANATAGHGLADGCGQDTAWRIRRGQRPRGPGWRAKRRGFYCQAADKWILLRAVEPSLKKNLLNALVALDAAAKAMPSANPKPDLRPLFARIDELTRQLPRDTDPALLHYLHKKSYEKARLFLQGHDAENQVGIAGMSISGAGAVCRPRSGRALD